jgi:hypothetical protein
VASVVLSIFLIALQLVRITVLCHGLYIFPEAKDIPSSRRDRKRCFTVYVDRVAKTNQRMLPAAPCTFGIDGFEDSAQIKFNNAGFSRVSAQIQAFVKLLHLVQQSTEVKR